MVHESQDQKVEGSVSLQEDLELSSSDSDEDLQQMLSNSIISAASTSHDKRSKVKKEAEKEESFQRRVDKNL